MLSYLCEILNSVSPITFSNERKKDHILLQVDEEHQTNVCKTEQFIVGNVILKVNKVVTSCCLLTNTSRWLKVVFSAWSIFCHVSASLMTMTPDMLANMNRL